MRRGSSEIAVALLAAGLVVADAASADPIAPFDVDYEAPPSCPSRELFVRQIRARTDKAVEATADDPAVRRFEIRLDVPEAGRALGRMRTVDPSGTVSDREVPGETCQEVVAALALIAAIVIDPDASPAPLPVELTQPEPPPEPAPALPPPSPPPPTPAAPPTITPARPSPPAARPPSVAGRAEWEGFLGARAGLEVGPSPELLLGGALLGGLSRSGRSAWEPAFDLGLHAASGPAAQADLGEADFSWFAARLRGCPVRVPVTSPVHLRPCAWFTAGAVSASGSDVPLAKSAVAFWADVGLGLRFDVELHRLLLLTGDGGVTFPLSRDRFRFDPAEIIHVYPSLGGSAGLGLLLRL